MSSWYSFLRAPLAPPALARRPEARRERPPASPDGYSYEIAARYGDNTRRVELADHHIPDAIGPLVRALTKLLP